MKKIIFLLLFSLLSLYAHQCTEYELDKAEYFANRAAEQIVSNRFDGGQGIYAKVNSCDYNSYSHQYTLRVEIHWNGEIFASNHYECDGVLRVNDDGLNPSFTIEWMNSKLQSYVSDRNLFRFVVGSVIVLGALSQQQN